MRTLFFTGGLFAMVSAACTPPPDATANPTWADVEPILRGQCNYCHGATAEKTGSIGAAVYRLDFYDLQSCGDAALAMSNEALGRASAALLTADLTVPATGDRPRMPPAPAAELEPWQRDTLLTWAANPVKGPPPAHNQPPFMRVQKLPVEADKSISFTVVTDDPEGHPVVGIIRVADAIFRMDRPGSFAVNIDASTWPEGPQRMRATLCDGWTQAYVDLGQVQIKHKP